jgi:predicted MPP superfamily phosphohydrolase
MQGLRVDLTCRSPAVVRHRVDGTVLPQMRIVVISDVHSGGWWATEAMLGNAVALANAQGPDLAIFAGDAVSDRMLPHRRVPPDRIAAALAGLRARLGAWAVLGNHDWKDDRLARRTGFRTCTSWEELEKAGLPVLHNRAVELDGIWLVGVESRRARRPLDLPGLDDPDAAFERVPAAAPAILLAHEPDIFAEDDRAVLQISGHTHGGQIAPFGWTPVIPSDYGSRYAWGHYEENGRHLVVSGGLGFVGIPLRVGRPPEITVIDISGGTP